jgi:hypothetical protein
VGKGEAKMNIQECMAKSEKAYQEAMKASQHFDEVMKEVMVLLGD